MLDLGRPAEALTFFDESLRFRALDPPLVRFIGTARAMLDAAQPRSSPARNR